MITNVNNIKKIKPSNHFLNQLQELIKATEADFVDWDIKVSTSEYNDVTEKPVKEIDGKNYTIDECFVSYYTNYKGNEFLLITYEQIYSNQDNQLSTNLVFTPPLGNRFFDLTTLGPYAIECDKILTFYIHNLWNLLIEKKKASSEKIMMTVDRRSVKLDNR